MPSGNGTRAEGQPTTFEKTILHGHAMPSVYYLACVESLWECLADEESEATPRLNGRRTYAVFSTGDRVSIPSRATTAGLVHERSFPERG